MVSIFYVILLPIFLFKVIYSFKFIFSNDFKFENLSSLKAKKLAQFIFSYRAIISLVGLISTITFILINKEILINNTYLAIFHYFNYFFLVLSVLYSIFLGNVVSVGLLLLDGDVNFAESSSNESLIDFNNVSSLVLFAQASSSSTLPEKLRTPERRSTPSTIGQYNIANSPNSTIPLLESQAAEMPSSSKNNSPILKAIDLAKEKIALLNLIEDEELGYLPELRIIENKFFSATDEAEKIRLLAEYKKAQKDFLKDVSIEGKSIDCYILEAVKDQEGYFVEEMSNSDKVIWVDKTDEINKKYAELRDSASASRSSGTSNLDKIDLIEKSLQRDLLASLTRWNSKVCTKLMVDESVRIFNQVEKGLASGTINEEFALTLKFSLVDRMNIEQFQYLIEYRNKINHNPNGPVKLILQKKVSTIDAILETLKKSVG